MSKVLVEDYTSIGLQFSAPQLYMHQNELLKFINENDNTIIYKERQEGVSFAMLLYIFWYAVINPDVRICFFGESKRYEWDKFSRLVKTNCGNIKSIINTKIHNQDTIVFENDSIIQYYSYNSRAYKGFSVNLAYLSEFNYAKDENKEEILASTSISMSNNGKCIITTDRLGTKNKFFGEDSCFEEYFFSTYSGKREIIFEKAITNKRF